MKTTILFLFSSGLVSANYDPKDMYCKNNNTEWKKYCENAVLHDWMRGVGAHSRIGCGKLILILHHLPYARRYKP